MSERNLRKTQRWHCRPAIRWIRLLSSAIKDSVKHPLYKKIIKRTIKLKAHDENNDLRNRRPCPRHGDPPAVQGQEMARS